MAEETPPRVKPQKRGDMSDMVHRIKEQVRLGHRPNPPKDQTNGS